MKVRMGELLVKAGVVTDDQLRRALQEQRQWGGKIGDILVRLEFLTEEVLARALSKQLSIARVDIPQAIPREVLARIPAELAEEWEVVPIELLDDGRTLVIATADPLNINAVDQLRATTGLRVVPKVAAASPIRQAIARLYQGESGQARVKNGEFINNAGTPLGSVRLRSRAEEAARLRAMPHVSAMPLGLSPAPAPMPPGFAGHYTPGPGTPSPLNLTPTPLSAPLGYSPRGHTPPGPPHLTPGPGNSPGFVLPPMPAALPAPMAPSALPPVSRPPPGVPVPSVPPPGGPRPAAGNSPVADRPGPPLPSTQPPPPPPGQAAGGDRFAALEESQRREVAALKALVELLVQKGVISLDEYLSRLKR